MNILQANALGPLIDNVFHNTSNGTKKVTAKLMGNNLILSYQTIINFSREEGLHLQSSQCRVEGSSLINDRMKLIKQGFKEATGKALKLTKSSENDLFETITTNPYSHRRIIKYILNVQFEIME
jgi:hypothetical protein